MLTPWEIVSKEMIPPAHLVRNNLAGRSPFSRLLLLQPRSLRKMKQQQGGDRLRAAARNY